MAVPTSRTISRFEMDADDALMAAEPERAPEYPGFRSPCNGCGLCCAAEPCDVARQFLGATQGPCPALEFEGGRFWCGVIRRLSHYLSKPLFGDGMVREILGDLLGIGQGCDSSVGCEGPSARDTDSTGE